MKQKHIFMLVGVLAVLLVAAWLSGYFSGPPSTVETPQISVEPASVETITVRKGNDEIVARRTDDGWRLESPVTADVDTTASSALLSHLSTLHIENMVSSNPERYGLFQVDSAQATYIRLDGTTPVEMFVGKSGPDFQSRYIRLGDDARVFLATDVPSSQPTVDRWRNKQLWANPKEGISTVSVTTPDASYEIANVAGGWMINEDGRQILADSAKVQRYLTRIASVKADGFLMDVPMESVTDSTTHSVEVSWVNGGSSRLEMKERASDAAAVAPDVDGVIKLYTYRVKSLAPAPADLLPG